MKSFEKRLADALPAPGNTITYGTLRTKSKCKRGLSDLLESMRDLGKISFDYGTKGEITDSTPIRVNETLTPEQFRTNTPPIPGTELMKMFGFDHQKSVVSVSETGVLSIIDPCDRFQTSLHIGVGLWARI